MKKKFTAIIMLTFILCFVFVGCSWNSNSNNNSDSNNNTEENLTKITSVSIYTEPTKNFYTIGESFLKDGGKLKIVRANKETEIISFNDSRISFTYPKVFSYWTDNQRIGVQYKDPLNADEQSEIAYFGVRVGLDIDYKVSGYSKWNNNEICIYYPSSYSVQPNEGETGVGGATYIDYTKNIVTFSGSSGKAISIKSGSSSALSNVLNQSISYLDSYYTQQYQEAYRKSYNDNSLQVTVNHKGLTNAEYVALGHFQWKDSIHQIIQIKKSGTFLGLGDWSKRIDQYIIHGNGNTIDISFHAKNSTYDNSEIIKVLNSLIIKYSAVYTDAP